jgi:ABC-type enterobactin transport system permease subunit
MTASKHPAFKLLLLAAVLVVCFSLDLAAGSASIPLGEVLTVLTGGDADRPAWARIVLQFRTTRSSSSSSPSTRAGRTA